MQLLEELPHVKVSSAVWMGRRNEFAKSRYSWPATDQMRSEG